MTNRETAKQQFSAQLREDLKEARKCVKGKPCGGRCIPANWNCRLKGEGDTPPTRGGRVARTPEIESALKSFKKKRRNRSAQRGLTGLAILAGGAAAGSILASKGESVSNISKTASTAGGLITALNPALATPVALAAAGASMGAFGTQARQERKTARALKARVKSLEVIKKGIDTRISKKENERKLEEKTVDQQNRIILGVKTKTNKSGQYTDKDRKIAFAKLKTSTRRLSVINGQLTGLYNTSKRIGLEIVNTSGQTPEKRTQIQNTMNMMRRANQTIRQTRSARLANRRNLGLTGSGKPGAKPNPTPWYLQSQNLDHRDDAVSSSKGIKCGGSHISREKKCTKGSGSSLIGAVAVTAGIGFLGVAAGKAIDDVVRVRSRQFGEPNFRQFNGNIGDVEKYASAGGKQLAAGAFGSTKLVNVEGSTFVVKTPKKPGKAVRKSMAIGLDAKATRNLYRAQGRMTNSEVANTRIAASLGLAPRVVAANKNALVSEVAKGKPASKLNDTQAKQLHSNLARLHRAGIAHNDLKPDNFFVDKSNKIQFIDFGLSQRSSTAVAREWFRAMNPESPNPLLKATGTATGSFNLRRFNNKGYVAAEKAMKTLLKGDVTEDRIIKAGKDPKTAKQLQLIVNNYYQGKYNRVRNDAAGKKCGGSYISANKKCSKNAGGSSNARALAKGFAASILIAGGAAALSSYKLPKKSKTSARRQFGLTSYQKKELEKLKAKRSGKYGAYPKRSFTSQQMPYYTEADRIYAVKHKRLFRDSENIDAEGKKYSKTVTDPKTGRKRTVKYGAKGYRIAPGTDKGNRYCARSFGDMKSHGKDCSGKDRNTPLCLSRAKWKCSGKQSRRS